MPGVAILELDCSGSMAGKSPSLPASADSTIDAERCENVCRRGRIGEIVRRHVHRLIEVIAPVSVLAMRSSNLDSSVPMVG